MNKELLEITELTEEEARYHIEETVKNLTKETDSEVIAGYSDTIELIVQLRIVTVLKEAPRL